MIFKSDFFIALNNWQRGWAEIQNKKEELALKLKSQCEHLDDKYKTTEAPCFRKRYLHSGELVDVLLKNAKHEGITSWTLDQNYAEFFKGKFKVGAVTAAVFQHQPLKEEIILNIINLWECPDFISQLEVFRIANPQHCDAIDHFKAEQCEVILEVPLRGTEICLLSGISSSFDDLCDSMNTPEKDRPKLFKKLIEDGLHIEEVTFIKKKAAQNAVNRTIQNLLSKLEITKNQQRIDNEDLEALNTQNLDEKQTM